jgi:hypothetical protein
MGISKQAGYNAVKRCGIPVSEGLVDPEIATALYKRRTRARVNAQRQNSAESVAHAAPNDKAEHKVSYEEATRRRQVAEAELAERRLLEERGTLVRVEKVRFLLSAMLSSYRTGLMQIPNRIAAILAAENDQRKIAELLEIELRLVMQALVDAGNSL